jgi:hypothetical protein
MAPRSLISKAGTPSPRPIGSLATRCGSRQCGKPVEVRLVAALPVAGNAARRDRLLIVREGIGTGVGKSWVLRRGHATDSSISNGAQPDGPETPAQLLIPKEKRIRDKAHVAFVAKEPCLVCGRKPAQAHHIRFAQPRALGLKVSDEFTVPLCNGHHDSLHRTGDERAWWARNGHRDRPKD